MEFELIGTTSTNSLRRTNKGRGLCNGPCDIDRLLEVLSRTDLLGAPLDRRTDIVGDRHNSDLRRRRGSPEHLHEPLAAESGEVEIREHGVRHPLMDQLEHPVAIGLDDYLGVWLASEDPLHQQQARLVTIDRQDQ